MIDGQRFRSWFEGLKELEKFSWKGTVPVPDVDWLKLDQTESLLDDLMADQPAQYSTGNETHPLKQAWANVTTTLSDLDTTKEHFVKVPDQHIVIDLDKKDENGNKSLALNLEAAKRFPPTYAEVSRGGDALHLHFDYEGNVELLADADPDGEFEIKKLLGGASLRRRVSFNNGHEVSKISSGLPLKEEKVLSPKVMSSEKGLRGLIAQALAKEIHKVGTKPNMDFIKKVLDDANAQGMVYDVSDMWDEILAFAMGSSNQRQTCLEIALGLKLKSDLESDDQTIMLPPPSNGWR